MIEPFEYQNMLLSIFCVCNPVVSVLKIQTHLGLATIGTTENKLSLEKLNQQRGNTDLKLQLSPAITDVKGLTNYVCYIWISVIANLRN